MPVSDQAPLRVLVFYQGDPSKPWVEAISTSFRAEKPFQERVVIELVKEERKNGSSSNLSRLMNAVKRSDVAVALLTEDFRAASEAGNLWLEIALWYALKDPFAAEDPAGRSILLLRHHNAQLPWPVTPISNLRAVHFEDVADPAGAVRIITNFLADHLVQRSTEADPDVARERVHRTLGAKKATWNDERRTHCTTAAGPCSFRPPAVGLIAELLRVVQVNRDLVDVALMLDRIGPACDAAIRAFRGQSNPPPSSREREDALHNLIAKVSPLRTQACAIAMRDRLVDPASEQSKVEPTLSQAFDLLSTLLKRWVRAAHQHVGDEFALHVMDMVPEFCTWAANLLITFEKFEFELLIVEGVQKGLHGKLQSESVLEAMDQQGRHAGHISRVLTVAAEEFHNRSATALAEVFRDYDARGARLGSMLARAVGAFPHNRGAWMNIWEPIESP